MDGENDFFSAGGGGGVGVSGAARRVAPRYVEVPALARPGGHYSHAAVGGGLVFVSGQLPVTPDGVRLVDAGFEEQALQVLANVREALLAAGSGVEQLLQVRVYICDLSYWPVFDRVYSEWVGGAKPARAVVPTGALHFGFKVEVEVVGLSSSSVF